MAGSRTPGSTRREGRDLAEEALVVAEKGPPSFRESEDELPIEQGKKQLLIEILGKHERPFLAARRTQVKAPTRKRPEMLVLAFGVRASGAGDSLTVVTARDETCGYSRTGHLPKGMRALWSLLLVKSEMLGASVLAAVPEELEEFSIVTSEKTSSLHGIERFSNLRTLILNMSPEIRDLSVLGGMKKLSWAGLPPQITQEQFSVFVAEHPGMKIAELIKCEGIRDLSSLRRLTGLTGLIVSQFSGNLEAMGEFQSLEFLGTAHKLM